MSFTNSNDFLTGRKPAVFPAGGEVVAPRVTIDLVAADLDANDAGSVMILPAGCVPAGPLVYDSTDLDTNATPTIAASVGIMNSADTDLETVLVSGITASRDGSAVAVVSTALMALAPASVDRRIGIKFTAAAATKAAGTVGLTLPYRTA